MLDILADQPADTLTPRSPVVFSTVKDAYSGCVLTFITGPAKGLSARILEYWPAGALASMNVTEAEFRIFFIRNEYGADLPTTVQLGSQFVINGRAFAGTGIGYNPAPPAFRVNAVDANSRPFALLPNPAFFTPTNPVYGIDPAGLGGANEDYDAPDFQNPFLAFYAAPYIDPTIANATRQIKPSFHDPALLSYWARRPGGLSDINLVRQVFFRPNPIDHPVFHATTNPLLHGRIVAQNPNFELGPWDVDNDGDGVADSVWVDPGYPAQMTKQGRLYKPLAAVLILDLDNRLNVNAHDSPERLRPNTPIPGATTSLGGRILAGPPGTLINNAPRGSGYGPAEIRLSAALSPQTMNALFSGTGNLPGRYGLAADGKPGRANATEPFFMIKYWGVPNRWYRFAHQLGLTIGFGTPNDVQGLLAVALDPHGQPLWDKTDWHHDVIDPPYELDLSRYTARGLPNITGKGPFDSPFSVGELEQLLRPNDIDSSALPPPACACA